MSELSQLDVYRLELLYPDIIDDEGNMRYLDLADAMGMDSKSEMTASDYQAFYDSRPDLQKAWKDWAWYKRAVQEKGGRYEDGGEVSKVQGEINKGGKKVDKLDGNLTGIPFEPGDQYTTGECGKGGMGGKTGSGAGFACWNFWYEIGRGNRTNYDGNGINPSGSNLTVDEILDKFRTVELNKEQNRELMLAFFGDDFGFNQFNKFLDGVKRAYDVSLDMTIDDNAAAYMLRTQSGLFSELLQDANAVARGEESTLSDETRDALANLFDPVGSDNIYTIDASNIDEVTKATTPYSFDRNSRYYGETDVVDGIRTENDSYYLAADAGGWSEHPLYGTQLSYPRDDGTGDIWTYSIEMGWYYSNENHDWIWTKEAGSWMYPVQNENGALYFYGAHVDPEGMTKGEWFFPNFSVTGDDQVWDFNDQVWRNVSEVKDFVSDPTTGLGIAQDELFARRDEARGLLGNKFKDDYGREATEAELDRWVVDATDEDGWSDADEQAWGDAVQLQKNFPMDSRGRHYDGGNGWKFRVTNDGEDGLNGWFYEGEDSQWTWNKNTGWIWNDPNEGNWYWSKRAEEWVWPKGISEGENSLKNKWITEEGGLMDWSQYSSEEEDAPDVEQPVDVPQNPVDGGDTFIKDLYLQDLGREPDESGLEYWTDRYEDEDGWSINDEADWNKGVDQELASRGDNVVTDTSILNPRQVEGVWYEDDRGIYYNSDNEGWKFRAGKEGEEGLAGWFYDHADTFWTWNENTGWLWSDPSQGNWYFSKNADTWVWPTSETASSSSWMFENGSAVDWASYASAGEEPGNPPTDTILEGPEPGTNIPDRISYDDGAAYYDPEGFLTQSRNKLNDLARDLAYEGYDQGLIMKLIRGTEVYKDMMDWATGREDQVAVEGLIDDIVEQVAEVNARKGNIATNLDMFDARGGAMLDPRMTLEEKLAIRTAKPSRPATQSDVDSGLAEQVGQIIRNPDYDPTLSYYFEYRNPETGQLETRAFRPDMPGKQTFMQEQERLIDGSKKVINNMLDDMYNPVDNLGNSKFDLAMQKQQNALRDKNIIAGGVDDPTTAQDESLGLYTNEGMNALNYVYGDNADSQMGKMQDYNAVQKHLRDQQNYLDRMDAQRDLDISSKIRTAIDDLDPVERARDRAMDRVRLARLGGGVVSKDKGGVRQTGGLFENQLQPELDFKDLDNVTGLGDTYTQDDLDAAGISTGLSGLPVASSNLKNNQYYNNINALSLG